LRRITSDLGNQVRQPGQRPKVPAARPGNRSERDVVERSASATNALPSATR